jgi:benzodiazapine receptor
MATIEGVRTWYQEIAKPSFTPPDAVFGPVWTTLYATMGVAAFLVWKLGPDRRRVRGALLLFCIQLVLNGLWSLIFFGLRSPGLALVEILSLLVLIAATTREFWGQSRAAGLLMVPYLAWVSFATVLNAAFWRLN